MGLPLDRMGLFEARHEGFLGEECFGNFLFLERLKKLGLASCRGRVESTPFLLCWFGVWEIWVLPFVVLAPGVGSDVFLLLVHTLSLPFVGVCT